MAPRQLIHKAAGPSRNHRRPVSLLALAPNLAVFALLMIPLGLPLSPWLGSLAASIQQAVRSRAATEAFTWMFAVTTVGMAGGNALGGVIIQGPRV